MNLTGAVTYQAKRAKVKVMSWLLNTRSNETSDKGAWIFWSLVIGLVVALIFKTGAITAFGNVVSRFVGATTGSTDVPSGWGQ
ncbi:hypothetical protein AMD01_21410 [Priestia koreensis]|uniref:Uncharacterized protein n=2 Tax=Priestia koreensis TaxID=284581 RepID=A0A0M0KNA1_9BACI|nr:hypothetical protein AMD01_21410 [Priestia koreensis]